MTKPLLIGLGHRKGSGKDTIGDYLVQKYGFKKLAFADPLKESAEAICGWTREEMEDQTFKAKRDEFWGFTPRWFLQLLGTEFGRDMVDQHLWTKALMRKLKRRYKDQNVVVTDVRFPNEVEAVTGCLTHRGVACEVQRPKLGPLVDPHPSEQALHGYEEWDHSFVNNTTIPGLQMQVDFFIERLL